MYDITLCDGGDCPLKNACFRYTAAILGRQDFFGSPPFVGMDCEHFLDNKPQISVRAYQIWLESGKPAQEHLSHWLQAENEVRK